MRKFLLFSLVALGIPLTALVMVSSKATGSRNAEPKPVGAAATAATTAEAAEPANPTRAKKCSRAVNQLDDVWKDWSRDGEFVTVQVRGGFYLVELDDKKIFDAAMRCVASDGRLKDQKISLVRYVDALNGKTVAEWSKYTGFEMKD